VTHLKRRVLPQRSRAPRPSFSNLGLGYFRRPLRGRSHRRHLGETTPFPQGGVWPTRVDVNLAEGVTEKRRQALGAVRLRPCSNGCGLGIAVAEGRIVGVRAYFDIPYDRITSSMVEAAPGKPVLLPVRADRFGPSLDKHAAVTAVEYSANVTPELNRKDGTVATGVPAPERSAASRISISGAFASLGPPVPPAKRLTVPGDDRPRVRRMAARRRVRRVTRHLFYRARQPACPRFIGRMRRSGSAATR
jgi:hypothetical protein